MGLGGELEYLGMVCDAGWVEIMGLNEVSGDLISMGGGFDVSVSMMVITGFVGLMGGIVVDGSIGVTLVVFEK